MVFSAAVDGKVLFEDAIDFGRGEGKEGWRSRELPLEQVVTRVTLQTRLEGTVKEVAGFWGTPRLIPQGKEGPQRDRNLRRQSPQGLCRYLR